MSILISRRLFSFCVWVLPFFSGSVGECQEDAEWKVEIKETYSTNYHFHSAFEDDSKHNSRSHTRIFSLRKMSSDGRNDQELYSIRLLSVKGKIDGNQGELSWDSDDIDSDAGDFGYFSSMLNEEITFSVTPSGEVTFIRMPKRFEDVARMRIRQHLLTRYGSSDPKNVGVEVYTKVESDIRKELSAVLEKSIFPPMFADEVTTKKRQVTNFLIGADELLGFSIGFYAKESGVKGGALEVLGDIKADLPNDGTFENVVVAEKTSGRIQQRSNFVSQMEGLMDTRFTLQTKRIGSDLWSEHEVQFRSEWRYEKK